MPFTAQELSLFEANSLANGAVCSNNSCRVESGNLDDKNSTGAWFQVDRQTLVDAGRGGELVSVLTLVCGKSFFVWVGSGGPPRLDELAVSLIPSGSEVSVSDVNLRSNFNVCFPEA